MQVDPIHQFEIKDFFPVFHIGGYEISFTNSALYMFIIVGLVSLFMIGATARRAVVPGRLQARAPHRRTPRLTIKDGCKAGLWAIP
jgi:F-type H+-transporting ATPase subunit a